MTIYEMAIKTFTTIIELFESETERLEERMDDLADRITKLEGKGNPVDDL